MKYYATHKNDANSDAERCSKCYKITCRITFIKYPFIYIYIEMFKKVYKCFSLESRNSGDWSTHWSSVTV